MEFKIVSRSEEETKMLGKNLAGVLKAGSVVALDGDLGAGKTVFTKGLCEGIGVTSRVASPTFTIVNEYQGGIIPVYHFDTYRLEGADDFLDSGLDEYFYQDGICVIEWSSVIEELLPPNSIRIFIRGVGSERDLTVVYDEKEYDEDTNEKIRKIFTR